MTSFTTWYLIIILTSPGDHSSQQTIEFTNQAQCEKVRDEVREAIITAWVKTYIECRSDR